MTERPYRPILPNGFRVVGPSYQTIYTIGGDVLERTIDYANDGLVTEMTINGRPCDQAAWDAALGRPYKDGA